MKARLLFVLILVMHLFEGKLLAARVLSTNANIVPIGPIPGESILEEGRAIAFDTYLQLTVRLDGSLVAHGFSEDGMIEIVPTLTNAVDVDVGRYLAAAVTEDGQVVNWGYWDVNWTIDGNVRPPFGMTNIVAVACGDGHVVALTGDGRVYAYGQNYNGQCLVPEWLTDVVAVAAGRNYSLALRRNGTVVSWGEISNFSSLTNVAEISAKDGHALFRFHDGTVLGYGWGPSTPALTNVVAISAGPNIDIALLEDGTVVHWPTTGLPRLMGGVGVLRAGRGAIAWIAAPVILEAPTNQIAPPGGTLSVSLVATSKTEIAYEWLKTGEPIMGATNASLVLTNLQAADAGVYAVVARDSYGALTNAFTVEIVGSPVIRKQPQSMAIFEHTNVVLSAEVISSIAASYQWFFNNTVLMNATNVVLSLENISKSETGDYFLVVSNSLGACTSAVARIEVLTAPQEDQAQRDFGSWVYLRSPNSKVQVAQTFRPAFSGTLANVWISACYGGETGQEHPTEVTLVETIAGVPGTNVLARAVAPALLCDGQFVNYAASRVYLQSNVTYALVFTTDAPYSLGELYGLRTSASDGYLRGDLWMRTNNDVWVSEGRDLDFVTFMYLEQRSVWLVMPSSAARLRMGAPCVIEANRGAGLPADVVASFMANGTLLGAATNAPYRITWIPDLAGNVELSVTFIDNNSNSWPSQPVQVTVLPAASVPNDDFTARLPLNKSFDLIPFSNSGAGLEPGEPRPVAASMGQTIWWEWTAPRTANTTIAVNMPESTNTLISIYTGISVDALFQVTSAVARCIFPAQSGMRYQISVDSLSPAITNGSLVVAVNDLEITSPQHLASLVAPASFMVTAERGQTNYPVSTVELLSANLSFAQLTTPPFQWAVPLEVPYCYNFRLRAQGPGGITLESSNITIRVLPSNDAFEHATRIDGQFIQITNSNYGATRQPSDPRYADNQGGASIWYRWTAPVSGLCTISGRGYPNVPLLLGVYVGESLTSLLPVVHNASTPGAPIAFNAIEGTTYRIMVDGYNGQAVPLTWSLILRPPHDDFIARRALSGDVASSFETIQGATMEDGEKTIAPPCASSSLWFTWVAPKSGMVRITTLSMNTPTALAVFTGETRFQLQFVTNSGASGNLESAVQFRCSAGVNYQVAVFGCGDIQGSFALQLQQPGLRLVSPAAGSVFRQPASFTLQAMLENMEEDARQITFYVNDQVIGTVSNAPFRLDWMVTNSGTYTITASAEGASGALYTSLPAPIYVYYGEEQPAPRIFSSFVNASCVMNAVGALYVFGDTGETYGVNTNLTRLQPQLARWPEGVTVWRQCTPSYAIAADGALYFKGNTRVAFPEGVHRWVSVTEGFNVLAVGDNGRVYIHGTSLIPIGNPNLLIVEALVGDDFIGSRTADGHVFLNTPSLYDYGTAREVPWPSGVTRWEAFSITGRSVILKGDDSQLYEVADGAFQVTPSIIRRPIGVNSWRTFVTGGYHVLAIADNGELYSWGRNWEKQLGISNAPTFVGTPTKVEYPAGVTAWTSVGAGLYHSLAIGNDCALYVWGANSQGQLGFPPSPPQVLPVRLGNVDALCGIPIVYTDGTTSRLPDGSFKLEFKSEINRQYVIQYSDDVVNWKSAYPQILGNGQKIEWIDKGPPGTDSSPNDVPTRFYRVIFAP